LPLHIAVENKTEILRKKRPLLFATESFDALLHDAEGNQIPALQNAAVSQIWQPGVKQKTLEDSPDSKKTPQKSLMGGYHFPRIYENHP
jgi:hypothetical protein